MDITGKVALVTGASSGIGAATALMLAGAGVKVGLAARRPDRLEALAGRIAAAGGEALALEMDVVDAAAVGAGVSALHAAWGPVDLLVNNAGIMPASDIDQFKTDEWHRMVDVNIKGVLNVTAAVLPDMIARRSGHIVNISSVAGRKVWAGLTVYSATKFAVAAFSEGLRMEVGRKHNIRVTCIQPGGVVSELYETTTDPGRRQQMEAFRREITFLEGEDIARSVLFAAQAPEHVTLAELFVMPTQQA
jgi:NADP-dependent 3-hydroxy acid dehydrogenase YdfG